MKLCITHVGPGNLACTLEAGTLRYKQPLAYSVERVEELSSEVVSILHRGNRSHKLTEGNLEQLRVVGEELARRLLPQHIIMEIRRTMGSLTLELDEELLVFPWELFYDGEQFLCRRFDMGRLVRTSHPPNAGVQRSGTCSPLRLLIVCSDPAQNLPQVEREGLEIVSQLDGNADILARMVTVSNLKFVRREIKDYDLVHFAGHAEPPASESGFAWRLDDGLLSAKEIAQMGAGRPMPSVVFSNACRSGTFNASDTSISSFGLAEAFLLAGVRHYIGTQWEMVDGQGAQFARHLYLDMSRGASMGAAVRNARNRVIAESGEGQLAWASYVMYGEPDVTLLKPKEREKSSEGLPALRLGVRATAPFKQRDPQESPITIEPLENNTSVQGGSGNVGSEISRKGISLAVSVALASLAAVLSLLVSGGVVYYLLFHGIKDGASPENTPNVSISTKNNTSGGSLSSGDGSSGAGAKPDSSKTAAKSPGKNHMVIHTRRIVADDEHPSIHDALAVLEACLLDGLSRRDGLTVMHKPFDDSEEIEPENRATHVLELEGHIVAKEVMMTVKLRQVKPDRVVSTSVIKAGERLLKDCPKLAEKLVGATR